MTNTILFIANYVYPIRARGLKHAWNVQKHAFSPLKLQMQLPNPAHRHARRRRAGFNAELDINGSRCFLAVAEETGVRSFIIASSTQTNSIVAVSIFVPITAMGDLIERACEFES